MLHILAIYRQWIERKTITIQYMPIKMAGQKNDRTNGKSSAGQRWGEGMIYEMVFVNKSNMSWTKRSTSSEEMS